MVPAPATQDKDPLVTLYEEAQLTRAKGGSYDPCVERPVLPASSPARHPEEPLRVSLPFAGSPRRLLPRPTVLLAALAAVVLCACSSGSKAETSSASTCTPNFAPGQDALLLTRDQSLYLRNMKTGKSCKMLTAPAGQFVTYPAWSPDGKQFAYIYDAPFQGNVTADWGSDLYVADDGGANAHAVLKHQKIGEQFESPTWLPSGQQLIYSYFYTEYDDKGNYKGQTYEGRQLDLASGASTTIGSNLNGTNLCKDGSLLAYMNFDQVNVDSYGIWVSSPDGQNARAVVTGTTNPTANFQAYFAPILSPDCKRIVFAAVGGTLGSRPAGPTSPLARLLDLFAPAKAEAHGPPWDLWVVNVDGTGLQRITHLNEDLPYAQWSSDGSYLLFIGTTGLYQVAPDGSNIKRIDDGAVHGQIAWRR
jgi:Tol biopolymer transport system component